MEGLKVYTPDPEFIWLPGIISSASEDGKKLKVRIQSVIGPSDGNVLATFENEAKLRDASGIVRDIDLTDPAIVKVLQSKHTSVSSFSVNQETTETILSLPLQNAKDSNTIGYEDMITIDHLHEASILHNLRKRFFHKLPYTYTGKICIAVNPYEWLEDLYSEETVETFRDGQRENKPPHVYGVSMEAFSNLRHKKENQSILVSGESGAGKTETTKILMSHLASLASNSNSKVIQQIIQANPLLESFGNAKTVRNDNSSRFGKFTELQFNSGGELVGARSRTYLLEKSRVTKQSEGEQNFHIFYQLLAKRKDYPAFQLDDPNKYKAFKFVRESDLIINGQFELESTFDKTCEALALIGIKQEIQTQMFTILAAILHLGQVFFRMGGQNDDDVDTSSIANLDQFEIASQLLEVDTSSLQKAICFRNVVVGREIISKPNTKDRAQDCRDALAKSLYEKLFSWLVLQINEQIGEKSLTKDDGYGYIGILDIFGFEQFEQNSFEQFCINYANEKLQQKFVQDVLKVVQLEYEEEQIVWDHIQFQDNQDVLTLIEGRMGVLSFLNEESILATGSDAAFISKIGTMMQNNPLFEIPLLSQRSAFVMHHYAGKVKYDADGFVEKHRDALLPDIKQAMQQSQLKIVQQMFTITGTTCGNGAPDSSSNSSNSSSSSNHRRHFRRPGSGSNASASSSNQITSKQTTVGAQFKESLSQLVDKISRTNVHYVRCLKPNGFKTSQVFHHGEIVNQLRSAGVIEAIRVSRSAYPSRLLHEEFVEKFSILLGRQQVHSNKTLKEEEEDYVDEYWRQKCEELMQKLLPNGLIHDYQVGLTRIYFREGILEQLETKRGIVLRQQIVLLQRMVRGLLQRQKYQTMKLSAIKIQSQWKTFAQCQRFQKIMRIVYRCQAWYRGQKARQQVQLLRYEKKIICLQAWFRGVLIRQKFLKQKDAARIIQFFWRGLLIRLEFKKRMENEKRYKALGSKVANLQKKLDRKNSQQQVSSTGKTATTTTTTTSSTGSSSQESGGGAITGAITAGASGRGSNVSTGRLSGSSTTGGASNLMTALRASNSSSSVTGGILDESQELITALHEENERLRIEMEAQQEEIAKLKTENRKYREWQKSKEVDEKVQKMVYRDQENKDLNYLQALEKEYERLRTFVCENFELPPETGTIPSSTSGTSNAPTSTGSTTAPTSANSRNGAHLESLLSSTSPRSSQTQNDKAMEAHGLLLKSAQRLSHAKTKSAGKGSARRVRDHWEEIKNFPPPMRYTLGSIPWKRLLTDWAQGNPKKLDYMTRWLKNVLDGGSIVSETFPLGVELKSVTPMMLDGFMQLVIPKLAERDDINVHVHTKEFIGTSMRITLSMKDGTKIPTRARRSSSSSRSTPSTVASEATTVDTLDDNTSRLSRPPPPPPPPTPTPTPSPIGLPSLSANVSDPNIDLSQNTGPRLSLLVNNESTKTERAPSPVSQSITAAVAGGPGDLTTSFRPRLSTRELASPAPGPPSPPQEQQAPSRESSGRESLTRDGRESSGGTSFFRNSFFSRNKG